jgi:hypothetical protein
MYSVTVPVGDAPSHVVRHVPSFRRHDCATQVAMATQAWSVGQLVALQQWAATQLAHVEAPMLKISFAAGQLPPSPSSVPLSLAMTPPSPGGELPPPADAPPHVVPAVGMQGPICCGWSLDDEQAHASAIAATARTVVAIAPARAPGNRRRRRPAGGTSPAARSRGRDGGNGGRDDIEKEES